jgi:hypothetical protein
MAADIGLGVAVELPEGIFNVTGEWRYSGMALQWWLWELDSGNGQTALLARVGETFYRPQWNAEPGLPMQDQLELEGIGFTLRSQGEARAERTTPDGHHFWLARFRQYVAPGKMLFFTQDRDEMHRLLGEELDAKLVQVYRG